MYQMQVHPILRYSRYILCIGFIIAFMSYLVPPYAIYLIIAGTVMFLIGFGAQLYMNRLMRQYRIKTSLGIDFLFPEVDSWIVAVDFVAMPKEPIPTEAELAEAEIAELIQTMQTSKRKRNNAASQLASAGPKVIPYVSQLLKETDPDLRAKGAAILRNLGSRGAEALPVLRDYVNDLEPVVQGQVICTLARIGSPALEATPSLVEQLKSETDDVRVCAALAIGRINKEKKYDKATLGALNDLLNDKVPSVQTAALIALMDLGAKVDDDTDLLINGLRDVNPILALQCAQHLGNQGKAANEAIPDLIEALKSNHPIIQIIVSHALYHIGYDPLALLRPILVAARSGEIYVKLEALEILEDMGPAAEPAIQAYVRMLGDKNTLVRVTAVRAIGFLGEKGRVLAPQLRKALNDPAKAVRYHAELNLKALGEPLEEPMLIEENEGAD
ncbi:MAG: HEAT repeat domain-containing protein [Promethearchaeota archaeon]